MGALPTQDLHREHSNPLRPRFTGVRLAIHNLMSSVRSVRITLASVPSSKCCDYDSDLAYRSLMCEEEGRHTLRKSWWWFVSTLSISSRANVLGRHSSCKNADSLCHQLNERWQNVWRITCNGRLRLRARVFLLVLLV